VQYTRVLSVKRRTESPVVCKTIPAVKIITQINGRCLSPPVKYSIKFLLKNIDLRYLRISYGSGMVAAFTRSRCTNTIQEFFTHEEVSKNTNRQPG
jgi:hypothetical protein